MASHSQEIILHVDGQAFKVHKKFLCEHSDYFSAMFSGNYVERERTNVSIDVVNAKSMEIILKYIDTGEIDLYDFDLATVGVLAIASNFLQITKLSEQIEYWLDYQLSFSNWVEIMTIAEKAGFIKLQELAGAFGLLTFKEMKPKYIPNVEKLFWYLSHPSLNTDSELGVFEFGHKWVLHSEACACADILLVVLGCLDVKKLNNQDLKEIKLKMSDCENSLAAKVVECMKMILDNKMEICVAVLDTNMQRLCETFSESVYVEVLRIVKYSHEREYLHIPVVPIWKIIDNKLEYGPHYLYKFTKESGFEEWLKVASKDLWGWSIAPWGASKVVQVCGEVGRGTGQFMNDVKIYDALRMEWNIHGMKLPSRRHAGVTIAGDTLFVVGGVGGFRVIEDSAYTYNLKHRTWKHISNFPDAIQSPGICTHYGSVYASGHKNIYRFDDMDGFSFWTNVMQTEIRVNRMVSFKDHVYCTQNYFSQLYRFRPDIDKKLEIVTCFSAPPIALCAMGTYLMVFTRSVGGQGDQFRVETYSGPCMCPDGICLKERAGCGAKIVWSKSNSDITVNDVAGACTTVMKLTKINTTPSNYHKKYLARFGDVAYQKEHDFV